VTKLRFTDCMKWSDPWFMELAADMKLLWIYLCDTCDNAGVWVVNQRFAEFVVGTKLDWAMALNLLEGRIEAIAHGKKWRLTKFLAFQHPMGLGNSKPHQSVIRLIRSHGFDFSQVNLKPEGREYLNSLSDRLSDTTKDKEEDKDKQKTQPTPRIDSSSSEAKNQSFAEWLGSQRLADDPKAVGEFKTLAKEMGCKSAEQTKDMIAWSVKVARNDGKTARYARHIETEARRWKDLNGPTSSFRKESA
jgi:hypothetical protein